uniref:Histone-binding protein N1/N2-like isoform X1 n=1 Tax=Crassostrea virginica TaxID=6565 RepID=A0A8B8CP73_CRAVI|nr:histone-binding protein N1/N2-like isoform X1 [Crassostrea virginica]
MDTPGTSSSSDKERMEAAESAVAILAQGKRNMVCGEIPNAVNQFQEACKVLAKAYGETAKECAEAYFYYGQSLLDLARMETGVLGNALQGVPEEEETEEDSKPSEQFEPAELNGEEREKLRMEVYDAMSEHKEGGKEGETKCEKKEEGGDKMETDDEKSKKEQEEVKSDKKPEEEAKSEKEKDQKKSDDEPVKNGTVEGQKKAKEDEEMEDGGEGETAEGDTAEEGEGEEEEDGEGEEGETAEEGDTAEESQEETEGGEKKENPDDISNLQLAWEMLELAKVIYMKEEDKKSKLKAAESYLKLGEISLETENYEQALSDFKECLKIQEAELEPDDRLLAETHYQLGLAYGFNKQYDESIEQYRKAIKVMEAKISKLKQTVEDQTKGKGKEPQAADDPVKSAQQEIQDLEEILPDIRSKIEDMEEEKKNIDELKSITKETLAAVANDLKPADTSEPKKAASDISHLVRRKRKPEEEETAEGDTKKTKQEEGSGETPTEKNGIANDKSESAMESDPKKKETMEVSEPPTAVAS